jgi:hypothetical protein
MTNIPIRVLVDWDNDGAFNPDTTKQNKPNLIPDSPYYNHPSLHADEQIIGNFEYGIKYDIVHFNEDKQTIDYGGLHNYDIAYIKVIGNFPIQLTPNQPYTFSVYLKNIQTAKKCVVRLYAAELNTANLNLLGTYTFDNLPINW